MAIQRQAAVDNNPDHTCPVAWAERRGLLDGSPVDRSWCLSHQRETLIRLQGPEAKHPDLLLWREDALSVYYAPWDWVNTDARVMLVGITAGVHQATEALREAQRCLRAGLSNEETLRRADAMGSFSGPMRRNLVSMLDGIRLHDALGINTTTELFGAGHGLAAHVSAIDYPVFVSGENYGGSSPSLTAHRVLRSLVRACLGARVDMTKEALVVPLGHAATQAVELLVDDGCLDERRCLLGVPHPSGANGWRVRQFAERREMLREALRSKWLAGHGPTPGNGVAFP